MVHARRRVSYVIPPPAMPVPYLQLPPRGVSRLGSIGPLLVPLEDYAIDAETETPKLTRHPRHRLGVGSLALDTSTQLAGRSSPEGILYSGGRDGLVMSWDLGITMKKRKLNHDDESRRLGGQWEIMTGWADDVIDEEAEDGDEKLQSDGDVLGDVVVSPSRNPHRGRQNQHSISYEHQWETDMSSFKPGKPSHFRQCAQVHADWVNDILLCNQNQTVISASSDGTVKAWNPHSLVPTEPSVIGSHDDYVRCLSLCEQNRVASGSFDRTIKLWDLSRSGQQDALVTLNPPDTTVPKSSVYALAADPYGRTIASGSPERVIRLWDPRSGKRTGKLVGHTDNIRAILVSEDAKYLLTGSSDASIKLWSLASQRCLHTFAHHTESVWSLHSSHPSLEIFYSGDRSGLVCKVDVENCSNISEGECVVLCQDSDDSARSDGINKIIAMDDSVLWTASGQSNIKRWRVPQRRTVRASAFLVDLEGDQNPTNGLPVPRRHKDNVDVTAEIGTLGRGPLTSFAPSVRSLSSEIWPVQQDGDAETTLYGIPFGSLVRLTSPNEPFTSHSSARGRDPEVATLYSAASIVSVPSFPNAPRSPVWAGFPQPHPTSPIRSSRTEDTVHAAHQARIEYEDRELAADAVPLCSEPDHVISGDHGLVRSIFLNDRIHALTVDTSGEVAVWDIVRAICLGRFLRQDVAAASTTGSTAGGSGGEKERSPREALETVRERIEGEAVISPWSTADTKAGVLAIHMTEKCFEAEIYVDEVGFAHGWHFNDESRLNIGKWVLRNLFSGFVREEQHSRRRSLESNSSSEGILHPNFTRVGSTSPTDAIADHSVRNQPSSSSDSFNRSARIAASNTVICSPKMIPALPPIPPPTMPLSTLSSPLTLSMIPLNIHQKNANVPLASIPQPPSVNTTDITPIPPPQLRTTTTESSQVPSNLPTPPPPKDGDHFSSQIRRPSLPGGTASTSDDFSGWAGPNKSDTQTPSTPGGLIGRLKSFGKSNKRPANDISSSPVPGSTAPSTDTTLTLEEVSPGPFLSKAPLEALLSGPFNPPPSTEAPPIPLSLNITLLISEEASPSFRTLYRGTVASTHQDKLALEEAMPLWLLEYLLLNKIPTPPAQVKISFVLLPWPSKDTREQLPELLNTTQSKLTASRYLRIRKLVIHVQEKLDKILYPNPGLPHSPTEEQDPGTQPRAEDLYEILCNDVLLPLNMSLAAVRQYVWRQSTELTMHYRRKDMARPFQEH